jgi:hypothetical protein
VLRSRNAESVWRHQLHVSESIRKGFRASLPPASNDKANLIPRVKTREHAVRYSGQVSFAGSCKSGHSHLTSHPKQKDFAFVVASQFLALRTLQNGSFNGFIVRIGEDIGATFSFAAGYPDTLVASHSIALNRMAGAQSFL